MNIKTRISKLEGNIKPIQQCDELDLSVLSDKELNRLSDLIEKNDSGITPDEYEELVNLCEKCRRKDENDNEITPA